jgi:hypothetical protein
MADGINIRILPKANSIEPKDLLLIDKPILGTQTITFSSVVLSGSQISFYSEFVNVSTNQKSLSTDLYKLSASTTTFISGGVSPSGKFIPAKVGVLYFAAKTKDYFVSVGTLNNKDWKRILTVNH